MSALPRGADIGGAAGYARYPVIAAISERTEKARVLDRPNRAILTVRRSLPAYPDKRTISEPGGMSQTCQNPPSISTLSR
jgi:hypothetical protein